MKDKIGEYFFNILSILTKNKDDTKNQRNNMKKLAWKAGTKKQMYVFEW